jgi:hypothetical protein
MVIFLSPSFAVALGALGIALALHRSLLFRVPDEMQYPDGI